MTAGLIARAPREDDVPAILGLFTEAFHRSISAEHYRWKLRTRPGPAENVVIVVDSSGRPVFHSAGIPARAMIRGTEYPVMLGADVMTASAHRKQGFNTRYSAEMYARWKDAGVALVLGLTNQMWGASARNVGLRPLGPINSLVLPLRPERVLARRTGIAALGGLEILGHAWRWMMRRGPVPRDVQAEEIATAGAEFNRIWRLNADRLTRSLVHDRDWVDWRYFASPDIRYRVWMARRDRDPVGYSVLRQTSGDSATIAEIFAPGDRDVFLVLLRTMLDAALHAGTEVLRTLAVPDTWEWRQLRRTGFRVASAGTVEHILLDGRLTARDVGYAKDWYFAAGDFDAV